MLEQSDDGVSVLFRYQALRQLHWMLKDLDRRFLQELIRTGAASAVN
jgi:hypothetical protein